MSVMSDNRQLLKIINAFTPDAILGVRAAYYAHVDQSMPCVGWLAQLHELMRRADSPKEPKRREIQFALAHLFIAGGPNK